MRENNTPLYNVEMKLENDEFMTIAVGFVTEDEAQVYADKRNEANGKMFGDTNYNDFFVRRIR